MDNNNSGASAETIALVRKQFLEDYHVQPDLYDECDLDKVNSDLWVSRFVNFLGQGPQKGLEHMKECFRWRKSFGMGNYDRTTIPLEVYQMAPVFPYGPDAKGRLTLIVRVKMHRKIEILEERLKKSFMDFVERIDAAANAEFGWNLVFDCQGAGYSNGDLEMLLFVMPSIRKYFPNGVKYVYVCGLPWILNSVARIAVAFMPSDTAKKIRFISHADLHDRIPSESLPDFLGGKCKLNYRNIPKGAKTCQELGRDLYGLTEDQVSKIMAPSVKYIREGEKTAQFES